MLAESANSYSETYTASSGPLTLTLVASERCWMELRADSADGPIVFEGTLNPGDRKAFNDLPGLWIRLGYPGGVVIQVDGAHITTPSDADPYNITVESPAAPTP